MALSTIDWVIVGIFFTIVLGIGWVASRSAGKSTSEFFLGGRGMPWWLLGISMVACTFSADTPNLVTGMVREDGVVKNWAWWAFLITGMVTVFIYARLWRRSNVMTDLEFYEIRYGGKLASFLRGFRSLYLGILFNCLIMGSVTLAAIKIGGVMLGLTPVTVVVGASIVVVLYAALGGIKGVIWADFFQYGMAMLGAVMAAVVAIEQPEIGSLEALFNHPNVAGKLDIMPDFSDASVYIPLLIIPIAVQWWAVWYPGAEPGGGGYIAQRMLSAKDEKNAIGATLLFNFAHYALRPWPWIIVALASLIIFPDLASIKAEFPNITDQYLGNDVAYPAMLTRLGPGWLGLVVASLIAAYMSTIGTHLNWGSSYVVNDFYKRFVNPEATEKQMVRMGRISTVVLMIISATFSLTFLEDATQAFDILLLSGAGTGLIYILRWFWWRINALTEIVAMVVATLMAVIMVLVVEDSAFEGQLLDPFTIKLLITVGVVTITWLLTTLSSQPENKETLRTFYRLTHPGGPGWKRVIEEAKAEGIEINQAEEGKAWEMPKQILLVFLGCIAIYSSLFCIGGIIYSDFSRAGILGVVAAVSTVFLFRILRTLRLSK
ncbi:sodium:solute symporter family protein [Fulvivirga sedimenti]|uniref:Na+:solute symporter n=1 Tax=Fulvivirga sedimenti TaxID=2879465 RepID=A0A9X1HVB3_9BACT|nr:sodium:solute symporter family protein [Fulvivirga sedimenti]MCA6074809.1 Na+:solute symporter [Fulvivirga sedimenti]MCA6075986.1 Na+:solute symporter [Fulvivirga sedimenti]MCA6077114.1 Na+:solute symporter [Fulvivirga sedimenti]